MKYIYTACSLVGLGWLVLVCCERKTILAGWFRLAETNKRTGRSMGGRERGFSVGKDKRDLDMSPSSQRLPGRWRILVLRSGYLVADGYGRLLVRSGYLVADGYCRLLLRSGYLVALWMDDVLSATATWSLANGCCAFLPVDALPPRLHPPSDGDYCVDVFFLAGKVSWSVEVEVPLLFSYCSFVSLGFRR